MIYAVTASAFVPADRRRVNLVEYVSADGADLAQRVALRRMRAARPDAEPSVRGIAEIG